MSAPLPGQVRIDGLYEGPSAVWEPQQEQVRDALRRAGAPEAALHALIEGGRASLEASDLLFPREQFAADPGEALALALEMLLEESAGGQPADWFSTLRVTDFGEDSKTETLIKVEAEGVRLARRESPWVASLAPTLTERLQKNWLTIVVVLLAGGAAAWSQRDTIREMLGVAQSLTEDDLHFADDMKVELGAFKGLLVVDVAITEGVLRAVVTRGPAYPADAEALRAMREEPGQSMERLAALTAVETGRVQLEFVFDDGEPVLRTLDLLDEENQWNEELARKQFRGRLLESVRLRP